MGAKETTGKGIPRQITIDFANILFCLNIDPERLELLETGEHNASMIAAPTSSPGCAPRSTRAAGVL